MWIGGTDGGTDGQIILGRSVQSSNDGGGLECGFQTLPSNPSLLKAATPHCLYPKGVAAQTLAILFFFLFALLFVLWQFYFSNSCGKGVPALGIQENGQEVSFFPSKPRPHFPQLSFPVSFFRGPAWFHIHLVNKQKQKHSPVCPLTSYK